MQFLPEKLENYANAHSTGLGEILDELERETHLKHLLPQMLSGPIQGQWLRMISFMLQPRQVLEIGTYTGYSAICLAQGIPEGGRLDTIDIDEELLTIQKKYFERAGLQNIVNQHIGQAMDIIPNIEGDFDLVFIDADKVNYSNYFDLVIDRVRAGGFIIADNVLWSGKVLDVEEISNDKQTAALHAYNQKIHADQRVENLLLPIRDGLMIARKGN